VKRGGVAVRGSQRPRRAAGCGWIIDHQRGLSRKTGRIGRVDPGRRPAAGGLEAIRDASTKSRPKRAETSTVVLSSPFRRCGQRSDDAQLENDFKWLQWRCTGRPAPPERPAVVAPVVPVDGLETAWRRPYPEVEWGRAVLKVRGFGSLNAMPHHIFGVAIL
jgi:hypothetical protein